MPQLTFPVTRAGLAVPVWIGLPGKLTAILLTAGRKIPAPVQVRGLLDTGSDVTVVASWVLQQLAIPAVTTTSTQTVAGPITVRLYEISLSITAPGQPGAPMLIEPDLLAMELATVLQDTDVLIGLDVLLKRRLVLDGPATQFTLFF